MEEKPPLTPGGKADNILVYSKSVRNGKSSILLKLREDPSPAASGSAEGAVKCIRERGA